MKPFYRKVYPRSWQTIKNNSSLLFFGLFASILGFQEITIIFNFNKLEADFLSATIMSLYEWISILAMTQITWANLPAVLNLILIFIIFAAIIILAISSQGALISAAVDAASKGKKTIGIYFSKHFQIGLEKFWSLLGLNIVNILIGYFFVKLIIQPLIYFIIVSNTGPGLYLLLTIIVFFILVPLVVIISFVTRYGAAYIILKNQNFSKAFVNGWNLFKSNWLITIENAILLIFITFIFFLLMLSAMVFAFTPFLILSLLISYGALVYWLIILIGSLLAVVIFILASGMFGAYYNLIWANIWIQLTGKGKSHSKVQRVTKKYLP
jgi:hypothetical protein